MSRRGCGICSCGCWRNSWGDRSMWKNGKLVQTAIGALIGTATVTAITGRWSEFLFLWVSSIPFTRAISYILFEKKAVKREEQESERPKEAPFVASEYFSRMEQAALDILEAQEPVDQTIILWWGLDGLRMNEDGELEWISRKKHKPATTGAFYQPCQSIQSAPQPDRCNQTQSTGVQIQAMSTVPGSAIMSQIQQPMPGYFGYSPYVLPTLYVQPMFAPPLQQCCVQYPSHYYGGCCRVN